MILPFHSLKARFGWSPNMGKEAHSMYGFLVYAEFMVIGPM